MFGPKPHAGTQNARKGLGMRLVNDLLKKWSPKPTSRTFKKNHPKGVWLVENDCILVLKVLIA